MSLISRLHASSWSFIGWAGLYAGLWIFRTGKSQTPKIFAEILLADFFVNVATPFLIGGAGLLRLLFDKRSKGAPWSAWVFFGGTAILLLAGAVLLILDKGGWPMLAGAVLFLSRLGWFYRKTGDSRDLLMALGRGLAVPWFCLAPALVISALVVGRQTLGLRNLDWVPLFGIIYFGTQAGFEELILRRIEKKEGRAK